MLINFGHGHISGIRRFIKVFNAGNTKRIVIIQMYDMTAINSKLKPFIFYSLHGIILGCVGEI
jgi:hypothetical protein